MALPKHHLAVLVADGFDAGSLTEADAGSGVILVSAVVGGKRTLQSVKFDHERWTPGQAQAFLSSTQGAGILLEAATERPADGVIHLDAAPDQGVTTETLRGARRWDRAELAKPERTPDGFVRAEGHITRAGVFPYQVRDGSGQIRTIRELRPPAVVFNPASMRSFALAPMTLGHPADNLTPRTVRDHQVGQVGTPRRDGDHMAADLLITHEDAIAALDSGVHQLSCGYRADVEMRGGTYTDPAGTEHRFDAIQTRIEGNHLAMVPRGRAGPTAAIRLDSGDGAAPGLETEPMAKIKINGVEHEVSDAVAQAYNARERADGEAAELRRQLDTANGQIAGLKASSKKDEEDAEAKRKKSETAAERKEAIKLIARAAPILEKRADELVELEPADIRRQVILKLEPKADLANKSEDYVAGLFEALSSRARHTPADLRLLIGEGQDHDRETRDTMDADGDAAFTASVTELENAWKPQSMRDQEAKIAAGKK